MSEKTEPVKMQRPPIRDDVWSRLRESLARLDAISNKTADPAAAAEKLAARAKKLRGRMITAEPSETPLAILTFAKGGHQYAVPVNNVIEVQSLKRFTPVPGTPPFILGVVHWRGDILSLLDIGKLFAVPEPGIADIQVCLIIEAAGHRVAIVALEVEEIGAVFKRDLRPAPKLAQDIPTEWIDGVLENNRVLLNLESILQDPRLVQWKH